MLTYLRGVGVLRQKADLDIRRTGGKPGREAKKVTEHVGALRHGKNYTPNAGLEPATFR